MICAKCGEKLTEEMINSGLCYQCGQNICIQKETEIFNEKLKEEKLQKKKLQEKVLKEQIENFLMTTGYNFEEYKIIKYNKVICAETVIGTGFFSEFSASLSDFFGVEDEGFASKLDEARSSATYKLIRKAINVNANAILGLDFDYALFSKNIIAVIVNGTAVTVEKL